MSEARSEARIGAANEPFSADSLSAGAGDASRNEDGTFAQGNAGGPGRPAGTPNKVNAVLKDDILQAYQERGGVEWLRSLPARDFVRLLEKVMPRQIAADVKTQAKQTLDIDFDSMLEDELERFGHTVGRKMRRIDGQVWSYEDADAALQLREVRAVLAGHGARLVGPLERDCLENAAAALRKHLPELQALAEALEARARQVGNVRPAPTL